MYDAYVAAYGWYNKGSGQYYMAGGYLEKVLWRKAQGKLSFRRGIDISQGSYCHIFLSKEIETRDVKSHL